MAGRNGFTFRIAVSQRAPGEGRRSCHDRPSLCYLDKPEIDALLAAPDRTTEQGRRDHSVLLFLYNTGARASEAAAVVIGDLNVRSDGSGSVRLVGKGGKTRHCPLWPTTMTSLRALSSGRSPGEPVFRNRRQAPLTRFVIHATVTRYATDAANVCHRSPRKRLARTSSDTRLPRICCAGVDINTIRAWLGHVSIDTTNVYAEVDLRRRPRCWPRADRSPPARRRRAAGRTTHPSCNSSAACKVRLCYVGTVRTGLDDRSVLPSVNGPVGQVLTQVRKNFRSRADAALLKGAGGTPRRPFASRPTRTWNWPAKTSCFGRRVGPVVLQCEIPVRV